MKIGSGQKAAICRLMTRQKDSRCLVLKGKQIVSDHSTFRGASNKEKTKAENRLKRMRRPCRKQEKLPEPSVEILPEVRQYPVSRRSEQALETGTASDQREPLEREHMMVELRIGGALKK